MLKNRVAPKMWPMVSFLWFRCEGFSYFSVTSHVLAALGGNHRNICGERKREFSESRVLQVVHKFRVSRDHPSYDFLITAQGWLRVGLRGTSPINHIEAVGKTAAEQCCKEGWSSWIATGQETTPILINLNISRLKLYNLKQQRSMNLN